MMQLVSPIDVEDALRVDIGTLTDAECFAPPAPDSLKVHSVCFTSVGGVPMGAVGNEHDVSIDCWDESDAAALYLANEIAGLVASLPLRDLYRHYVTASVNALPYLNPDPQRPTIPRATFRATVGVRGKSISF